MSARITGRGESRASKPGIARALCSIMEGSGFEPYDREWWHYVLRHEPYPDTYFDFPIP